MRVVLLGMNNPVSENPRHALFPHPTGCTGWRIWQMIREARADTSRRDYLEGFERVNLLNSREWDSEEARAAAPAILRRLRGREVVVFGEQPRGFLGLPKVLIHPVFHEGALWRQLPHPSGRCRWYNSDGCRMLASLLLAEMLEKGAES